MIERPMWDGGSGEHLDEGTIHAWLDGALDAASAERVAAHVRRCEACSALAAEARGLIAGASRIVSALDEVPAGTRPGWAQSAVGAGTGAEPAAIRSAEDQSLWRRLRVTPARAAIAATILVALGVTLTHDRVAVESIRQDAALPTSPREAQVGGASPMVAVAPPSAAQPKDELLDSAVARNLAITQGTRRMEAVREPSVQPAPVQRSAELDAPGASAQVAEGRAAVTAQRETAGVAADRLRVRSGAAAGAAASIPEVANAASARAQARKAAPEPTGGVASMALPYADAGARSCFNLESSEGGVTLGGEALPLVVVVDSGPPVGTRNATVRPATAGTGAQRASWTRSADDSVHLTLQVGGATGVIALGPSAGGRVGTMTTGMLEERMAGERADAAGDTRLRAARPAAPSAPAASSARRAVPLRVTLRPVACPTR